MVEESIENIILQFIEVEISNFEVGKNLNFIKFLKKREIIITEKAVQQNWERASRENKTLQGKKVL